MNNKSLFIFSKVKSQTSKAYCYVKNPYPCYRPPKENVKPPRIIHAIRQAARDNAPSKHPIWRSAPRYHAITHEILRNQRTMNAHRARAIDAIMECLAAHVNIVTGKVYMSLAQISDACGLTTYNTEGKPCYSRTSRAITEHLEALGVVLCDRIWDNTTGSYIPNIIWITQLFFVLIGYEYGKYLAAQNQQLSWENQKIREAGEEPITLTEARRRAKTEHIRRAFECRTQKLARNKQHRRARKIEAMDERKARGSILQDLVKLYRKEELGAMGYNELNRIITQRYYAMCKLASPPPGTG
ncbi:Probable replication-associated protein RepA1 (plasmid) [Candidatus Erwinia haradaeae]|uniref:Probable replication-associated protein RepA1 n=1 Tax=Candidatus Erwinia haradaeae TaxID=1922217 RepID=A0A451DDR9_9GAMM|nr:plasmid replication initiator RepA [Candidatus Erwinia haradaeae]VFP84646.1 Probable replication-associated protein RepA1 [Candidatus Erwinia haradaeae]